MKYIYLAFNWIVGVLFLLMGLVSLIDTPKAGVTLVLISMLLLPPVRNFVFSKTKKEISQKHRIVAIFALVMVFGVFVNQDKASKELEAKAQEAKAQAEQIAKVRQENIDYYNANKNQIISTAKNEFEAKNYNAVISTLSKYLVSGDEELKKLHSLASTELAAIKKREKTNNLLAQVKKIPASELENNNNVYKQLLALHPDNTTYKKKVDFYTARIKEEEDKRIAAANRKSEIEKQFSAWDGSHRSLERVIKEAMNDPDSYEHDKTVYWDRGDHLVVQTTYRGKNAFGGTVKNFVKAKVSLSGQILQILDQT